MSRNSLLAVVAVALAAVLIAWSPWGRVGRWQVASRSAQGDTYTPEWILCDTCTGRRWRLLDDATREIPDARSPEPPGVIQLDQLGQLIASGQLSPENRAWAASLVEELRAKRDACTAEAEMKRDKRAQLGEVLGLLYPTRMLVLGDSVGQAKADRKSLLDNADRLISQIRMEPGSK